MRVSPCSSSQYNLPEEIFTNTITIKNVPVKPVPCGFFAKNGTIVSAVKSGVSRTYEVYVQISVALMELVKKVVNFVKRHSVAFILYPLVACAMALFSVPLGTIASSILPPFAWSLSFSGGVDLVSDFIEQVEPSHKQETWVPEDDNGLDEGSLKKRYELTKTVLTQLKTKAPLGWAMFHGQSGAGKTAMLDAISRSLCQDGVLVFFLNMTKFSSMSKSATIDSRFMQIALVLNECALLTKKPPVLIIDEVHRAISGLNDCLKDSSLFPMNFNILAATTTKDMNDIMEGDAAFLTRFHGSQYKLDLLDEDGIIKTVENVKSDRFEHTYGVKVPSDVVTYMVEKVFGNGKVTENLRMKCTVTLLEKACIKVQTTRPGGTITTEDVDTQIKLHSDWRE